MEVLPDFSFFSGFSCKEKTDSKGFPNPKKDNNLEGFFPNLQKPNIIHKSGEKTRFWNLNPDIIDGFPVEPGSVTNRVVFNPSLDLLYSLPTNYKTREYYLAVLVSLGVRIQMLELLEFLKANQFTIRTGEGYMV